MKNFYYKWFGKIASPFWNYEDVDRYLKDKNSIKYHSHNTLGFLTPDEDNYTDVVLKSINELVDVIPNLMIVYMMSQIEEMFREVFVKIFIKNPKLLNKCKLFSKEDAELKLKFELNELLEFNSKEDYLLELAERGAKICISGSYEKVSKRLEKICDSKKNKVSFDKKDVDILVEFQESRNEIVHENKHYDINILRITEEDEKGEIKLHSIAHIIYKIGELLIQVGFEINLPQKN